MAFDRIGVLGAGSWGTALAQAAARAGRSVVLWARDPAAAASIQRSRENPKLKGVPLEGSITVTGTLSDAASADAILLAIPAQALRGVAQAAAAHVRAKAPAVSCAKGNRTRNAKIHDRGDRGDDADGDPGDAVRSRLRG
jgi:glycerol-3-phosphate dehydrogenase (NAD(P)+)